MSFANPAGLLLLATLPVILWLHLRRRWPRRTLVPAIAPWLTLSGASPPRRRRISTTLLLLLHLAAAALVSLALAEPERSGTTADANDRAVIVDTTTSMAAGDRWLQASNRVRELLADTRGRSTLVALGPRPSVLVAQDDDGSAVEAALAGLQPGGTGAEIDAALELAAAAAGPSAELVVVTDGGVGLPDDGAPSARWELIGAGEPNVGIVEVAARSAGGVTRLFARVVNYSDHSVAAPTRLLVDGRHWDAQEVTLGADESMDLIWTLPLGSEVAEVRLDTDDALPADDVTIVPVNREPLLVQLVGDADSSAARALSAVPDAEVHATGLGAVRTDGTYDAGVFIGDVPTVLPPGGVLLFNPPGDWMREASGLGPSTAAEGQSSPDAASGQPGEPNRPSESGRSLTASHEFGYGSANLQAMMEGLDFTGVAVEDLSPEAVPSWAEIVMTAGGRPAVFAGVLGDSRVVVFAFDPDGGNIARRLGFPILVARALEWASPERPESVVRAGDVVPLPPAPFEVEDPSGHHLRTSHGYESTGAAGLYTARSHGTGPGRAIRFAVLAGDSHESDLRNRESPGQNPAQSDSHSARQSRSLWPQLVALTLVVILGEGLLRSADRRTTARRRKSK